MRLRGKVDANQPAIVKALRAVGASVTSLADLGDGCPDLLVGFRGRTVLMELKASLQDTLTTQEIDWHCRWRGSALCVVRSVEEAIGAVGLTETKE